MTSIDSDEELLRFHEAGIGLIYNDFSKHGSTGDKYNVLHSAGCTHVAKSNVRVGKRFFEVIVEATEWLSANRGPEGINWKRCGFCRAETRERSQLALD